MTVLRPGDPVPDAPVWRAPGEAAVSLREALAGEGHALLACYPFDWSPTCTNELLLLRDRAGDLDEAGIRAYGLSRDTPWSQRAYAASLQLGAVALLSDARGEAAAALGVLGESHGIPRAERSAFLVRGGTVVASWMLGAELPDVDAVIAVATSSSR